jgi:FixJ family two-component response regulator
MIHTKGIDFIQKPYSIADLLQSIKASLQASQVK